QTALLERLLPGAPKSLSDVQSQASDFVNCMIYDPLGSRLLETIVTHSPGKIFKGLYACCFGPRIHSLVRNDIASYPAMKALNRLGKGDLVEAVEKILPTVPALVERHRFNVLKTLFERCDARQARGELNSLTAALRDACGPDKDSLVSKLCFPGQ